MGDGPKEERKTRSYKETMNIDIENINTIEKKHKVYTKRCRTIYEVIQQDIFDKTDIIPDDFIKHCNNNGNEAHNKPLEVKDNIKKMLMEKRIIFTIGHSLSKGFENH